MLKHFRSIYNRYKHGIPMLIYMILYLSWFTLLEKWDVKNYQIIHVSLDDCIPFCEVFVIPYFLWFAYVVGVVVFLLAKNKQDYHKVCTFLCIGMTVFLVISTLWPNGHHLRLNEMPRDNIFTALVSFLWRTDTPTNLWPSIHVFNSMGAHFAVMRSQDIASMKHGKLIRIASGILSVSIILSTVFIKQHSVFDVVTGILMGAILYAIVYHREWLIISHPANRHKRTPQAD